MRSSGCNGRMRPFFAWIHLYDAHAPYALPEPFRTMYHDAPYLGALAVLDAQVGRVARALEAHHVLDRTLLVVASDHGESLGEHGEDGHGIFVYQSTLRVALIMRVPGFAPRRVADVTRLADVMPTVLDLLHEPAPPMDGVSLVPLMTGRVKHLDLDAYSESAYPRRFGWSELYALRAGRYKFIDAPRPELYDLDVDPGEQHNIFNRRTALGSAMAARVDALAKSAPAREPVDTAVEGETASRLSALGYVGRGAVGCSARRSRYFRDRSEGLHRPLQRDRPPAKRIGATAACCTSERGKSGMRRSRIPGHAKGCGLGIIERAQIDLMAVPARQKPTLC